MKERISEILDTLKALGDNAAVQSDIGLLTFIVSLLPIPGVQQAGQVANKILTDKHLQVEFASLREDLSNANTRIDSCEADLEKIREIAAAVGSVDAIAARLEGFVAELVDGLERSEFVVDTSNWSVQAIIRQIIDADLVSISATKSSKNILRATQIKAKKTRLSAHDHSVNVLDGTQIGDDSKHIGFDGIGQSGDVSVEGWSINFIRRTDETLTGSCSLCHAVVQIKRSEIQGRSVINCPNCHRLVRV